MLYMMVSKTHKDLTSEEFAKLGELAKDFYGSIPEGVALHNDWAAIDNSRTFALVETENEALLEQIQAPFRPYVDIETIPVTPIDGWVKS